MLYHSLIEILRAGLLLTILIICVDSKQCMRNDDIGWREGNIYSCDDPELTECCEVDKQFICCERPRTKFFREQLQLWGALVFFVLGLVIFYLIYFKRDGCCTSDTMSESFRSLKEKFTFRKGFHSMNNQYRQTSVSDVKLTSSSEIDNDDTNWQFRKTHL